MNLWFAIRGCHPSLSSDHFIPNQFYGATDDTLRSSASSQPHQQKQYNHTNVAFALSGNHADFISEFEVGLKSVLLNAPLERTLSIHILADQDAILALTGKHNYKPPLFEIIQLQKWVSRSQIEIHVYDVSPHIPALTKLVDDTFTKAYNFQGGSMMGQSSIMVHTIGTYFRLVANRILPQTVKHVLYIDVDVVIISNLEELWREVETNPNALFHWGKGMCAGFVVMNVPRMDEIWTLAQNSPIQTIAEELDQNINDQLIFRSVNVTYPHEVHVLSDGWDMSAAEKWQPKLQYSLERTYPNVGMLHFNGGGGKKEAYFNNKAGGFIEFFPDTWGNAKYYVTLPWAWARYQAKSLRQPDSGGYPISISFE
ncbi:hypothetical protein ACHAXR_010713 [Thalassiosira sp. AJA248-18]